MSTEFSILFQNNTLVTNSKPAIDDVMQKHANAEICEGNIKTKVTMDSIAFYMSKKATEKSWHLKPRYAKWIFDIVVTPIIMYGGQW